MLFIYGLRLPSENWKIRNEKSQTSRSWDDFKSLKRLKCWINFAEASIKLLESSILEMLRPTGEALETPGWSLFDRKVRSPEWFTFLWRIAIHLHGNKTPSFNPPMNDKTRVGPFIVQRGIINRGLVVVPPEQKTHPDLSMRLRNHLFVGPLRFPGDWA